MDRADVDDAPAAPLRDQSPRRMLRTEEGAVQIRADHPLPRLECRLADPPAPADPGIVDQNIELAECLIERCEHPRHFVGIAYVRADREGAATRCADQPGGLFGACGVAMVIDCHIRTMPRQRLGNAAADAATGAGDQRHLSAQVHRAHLSTELRPPQRFPAHARNSGTRRGFCLDGFIDARRAGALGSHPQFLRPPPPVRIRSSSE